MKIQCMASLKELKRYVVLSLQYDFNIPMDIENPDCDEVVFILAYSIFNNLAPADHFGIKRDNQTLQNIKDSIKSEIRIFTSEGFSSDDEAVQEYFEKIKKDVADGRYKNYFKNYEV